MRKQTVKKKNEEKRLILITNINNEYDNVYANDYNNDK